MNDFPMLLDCCRSNGRLTHRDPIIAGRSVAFGLVCSLDFMLPAAYYFNSRFESDFELPVLSAINGGGNNMARASLTGALAGALVGLRGIPPRFISGLADSERLQEMAAKIADAADVHRSG